MAYALIDSDPAPDSIRHLTFVPFRHDGTCLAIPVGDRLALPSGDVAPGEHWLLDSVLRIALEAAGFRFQRVHPVAIDGDHLYAWIEGADNYRGDRPHTEIELTAGTAEQIAGRIAEPHIVLDAARSYRSQSEESYYADNLRLLEPAYLRADTVEGGSGVGGSPEHWRRGRESIVDGVHKDGRFCDLGCANGLLMESVHEWAGQRGITLEPYGVDISAGLVEHARERLPQWRDRIWLGNAVDWVPPDGRKFTFVHALFDFWPESRRADGVAHILTLVEPGGRLLMSQYSAGPAAAAMLTEMGYEVLGVSASTAWITPAESPPSSDR